MKRWWQGRSSSVDHGEVPSIRSVERKLSEWGLIPEGHGEGIQVGG